MSHIKSTFRVYIEDTDGSSRLFGVYEASNGGEAVAIAKRSGARSIDTVVEVESLVKFNSMLTGGTVGSNEFTGPTRGGHYYSGKVKLSGKLLESIKKAYAVKMEEARASYMSGG